MNMRPFWVAGAAICLAGAAGQAKAQSASCAAYNTSSTGGYFPGTGITRDFAFNTGEQLTMRFVSQTGLGGAIEYEIDTPRQPGLEVDQTYTTPPTLDSYVIVAGDQPEQEVSITGGGSPGVISNFQGTCQFAAASISSLTATFGPPTGGDTVVIAGDNLGAATDVTFGGVSATSFTVDSNTQIRAVAPAGVLDTVVDVQVIASNGDSDTTGAADDYLYGVPVIPTLTEWAMILMGTLLAGFGGVIAMRRRDLA